MSRRRALALALAVALVALASPTVVSAEPTIYWVDGAEGKDENAGEEGSPFATIGRAVEAAVEGAHTRINILPAEYDESVTLDKRIELQGVAASGTPSNGEDWGDDGGAIRGSVAVAFDDAVVDGLAFTLPAGQPAPDWSAIYVHDATGVQVSDNLIDPLQLPPVQSRGVLTSSATDLTVTGNVIRNVHLGVYLNPGATARISDNIITGTAHNAIGVDTAGAVVVEGNTISDNLNYGMEVFCFGAGSVIRRNNFFANAGLSVAALAEAASCNGGTAPTVFAYQNWWGHDDGPRVGSAELDPDDPAAIQGELSRAVISSGVEFDPWCETQGCPAQPVVITGVVRQGGAAVAGAVVTATWADGSQTAISAATEDDGAYRLVAALPWVPADGTEAVTLTARKDDQSHTRVIEVGAESQRADEDFSLSQDEQPASAATSEFSVQPAKVPADGLTPAWLTVVPRDSAGNRITHSGATVEFWVPGDTTVGDVRWNDSTQVYEAPLTASKIGTYQVYASVNSQDVPGSAVAEFVLGPPSGQRSTVTSATPSLTADGVSTTVITVKVFDGGGNRRTAGTDYVRFTTTSGEIGPAVHRQNGEYEATYRAPTVTGAAVITAFVRESLVVENETPLFPTTVLLRPGPASASRSVLAIDRATAPADGRTAIKVTVQVNDAHGNRRTLLPGESGDEVTITTTLGMLGENGDDPQVDQDQITVESDAQGIATAYLTSDAKGEAAITATVNDHAIPNMQRAAFGDVPAPLDASKSTITLSSGHEKRLADDTQVAELTVQAKNVNDENRAVAGDPVTLITDHGTFENGSTTYSAATDPQGRVTARLRAADVGLATVSGTIGDDAASIGNQVTVDFQGFSSPATSSLMASNAPRTANDTDSVTVTFQAKDAAGFDRQVGGEQVEFFTDRGTVTAGLLTTGANGSQSATLTAPSSGSPGLATVTAKLNGVVVASSVQVMFHPPAVATNTGISFNRNVVGADGVRTARITLQLKDANNIARQIKGADDVKADAEPGTTATDPVYVDDPENPGQWQFEVSSQLLRETRVTATVNGVPIGNSVMIKFEAPTSAMQSKLVRSPTSGNKRADGVEFFTIRVEPKNAAGGARTGDGDEVEFVLSGAAAVGTNLSKPQWVGSGASGAYESVLTSTAGGAVTVTGTINRQSIQGGGTTPTQLSFNFTPVASAAHSVIAAMTPSELANRVADGIDSIGLRVQAKSANGSDMTVAGDEVVITADRGTLTLGSETGSTVTGTTDSSGRVSFSLSSSTPGVARVTATLNGQPVGTPIEVPFFLADATTSSLSTNKTLVNADGKGVATITVTARDASGAPRTTGREKDRIALSIVSGTGSISVLADVGNGTYTATLQSSSAGDVVVKGTIGGVPIPGSVTVEFQAMGVAEHSTMTADHRWVTADNVRVATLTVVAHYESGKPRSIGGDEITPIVPPGVTASGVTDLQDGTYKFTVRSQLLLENAVISASVNGKDPQHELPTEQRRLVSFELGGDPSKSTISTDKTVILGDGSQSAIITVQAVNALSSNRKGGDDTIMVATTHGTLTNAVGNTGSSIPATFTADGKSTVTLRATSPGTATITATMNGSTNQVKGGSNGGTVTVTAQGPTSAGVSTISRSSAILTAGPTASATITVQAKAALPAPAADRETGGDTVVLTTTLGSFDTTLESIDDDPKKVIAKDNGNGTYTATFFGGTLAGTATITATINGEPVTNPATIIIEPAAASAEKSTITAAKPTITADGTSTTAVTVQLIDQYDNARTTQGGHKVEMVTSVSGVTLTGGTWSGGTYTGTLRASSTPGTVTVRARLDGTFLTQSAQVVMEAVTSASTTTVSATPSGVEADGTSPVQVVVQARTAGGADRTVGGDTITVHTTKGRFANGATTVTATDEGNGTYTTTLLAPTTAGTATVSAALGNESIVQNTTVEFTGASGTTTRISATPATVPADGSSTATIVVTARTAADTQRVTGNEAVTLATSAGSLGAITDIGDGTYRATLTAPTQAGTASVTGTIGGAAIADTAHVEFTAATDPNLSQMSVAQSSLPADGTSATTVTLTAIDFAGDPRSDGGDAMVFATTAGTLGSVVDSDDGTYSASLTAPTEVAEATVTATVGGSTVPQSVTVTFHAYAPTAPQEVHFAEGNQTIDVNWSAPVQTGGVPLAFYTVRATPTTAGLEPVEAETDDATAMALQLTGLVNDEAYTVTVMATNTAELSSPVGAAETAAVPFGVPATPAVMISRAPKSITLDWAPVAGNGREVIGYEVRITPTSGGEPDIRDVSTVPDTDGRVRVVINDLEKSVQYGFEVVATNAPDSWSLPSATVVHRFADLPGQPTGLSAVPGNGKVALSWTAPDNGGEAISTYSVTVAPSTGVTGHTTRQTGSSGSTFDFTGLTNGTTYSFTVLAINDLGSGPESAAASATPSAPAEIPSDGPTTTPSPTASPSPTPTPSPSPTAVPGPLPGPGPVRINGEDRASTAAAVSASHFDPGVSTVFVATSAGFADALAGGPAAAHNGGPILLVEKDRVPDSTSFELQRLRPGNVVVLGGKGAVSDGVLEALNGVAPTSRLSGADRFSTAAAVSRATFPTRVSVVYIATGNGFADALSGGAAAARNRGPVLLVGSDGIPSSTAEELRRLSPRQIVVLGGSAAIPSSVASQLDDYTDGAVERLSGSDRYATSAAISARMFPVAVDTVFVATGENFPDALAGVPAAAREKAPLLLLRRDAIPEVIATQLQRLRPRRIVILGGSGAVSPATERELSSYTVE